MDYCKKILLNLFIFLSAFSIPIFSQTTSYSFVQSFETSNPFKFWTSNATYTINYFGPSADRSVDGTKSLKMDITVNGSGTKDCFYYWTLPVNTNLIGNINFSAYFYMNSDAAQYVSLGYHYAFPPTSLERTPGATKITQYNTWFRQYTELDEDVIYHADYFAQNSVYGSTYDDFGRELKYLQLMVKARGSHRIVFYLDKIEIKGTILTPTAYTNLYNSNWNAFKTRVSAEVSQKHTQDNALPAIPTLTSTATALATSYHTQLVDCDADIVNEFKQMDGKTYFAPISMKNLKYCLGHYPSLYNLLQVELKTPTTKAAIFEMPPTIYNRLDGKLIPEYIKPVSKLTARVCKGEYEPFSLFLQAKTNLTNIKVTSTNLTGAGTISSSELGIYIAKVWYQNGYAITGIDGKWLTQELLIKNDNLIKVDETAQTNSLLVTKSDGTTYYVNISNATAAVPTNVKIKDSNTLLPFNLNLNRNKQIWITLHVPDTAPAGTYSGTITITSDQGTLGTVPINITVLPFNLDNPKIAYSVFYHGYVNNSSWSQTPFTSFSKSSTQFLAEMKDLKAHGVLYPTTYQSIYSVGTDLNLRNQAGLPKDRLYCATFMTDNSTSSSGLTTLKNTVTSWKNKMAQYGYSNFYAYGIDEATGSVLINQRPSWDAVHSVGGKIFTAGYYTNYEDVGDLTDCAVIQNLPREEQADLYHSQGNEIFSYRNPMSGVEDPEVQRRNYGLVLFKEKYDGVMNYAYQRNYKDIWNDFDVESNQPHPYRDHVYSYPITDGVINTVQWEGVREGVDDMRYMATLQNLVASAKSRGKDVSQYEQFMNSINPEGNLDDIRSAIIDNILSVRSLGKDALASEDGQVPQQYKLEQNFPNPFNPTTIIKYSIPKATKVSLKIYDILGKEVVTLVNDEIKEAGSYELNFNASQLSSGVYIYNIKTNDFVQSRKMMLMK